MSDRDPQECNCLDGTFFPNALQGFPFHSEGLGVEGVFARRCVSVRNRSCDPRMAVPMVSSARGVIFGCFQRSVASFRVAGVALCDIQTCFVTCRKSFLCGRRNTFATFSEDAGRRSTLDVSIVIFRGRRSTLDVSCGVFFANRIGMAASSGDKVQIPWQALHFVTCAENGWKPRAKHRF